MRRWVISSLTLWSLAWGVIYPAQADQIDGYVLNPSSDERIGGVEIAFYVQQDEQVSEIMRKKTDSEGRFSFSGPFLTTGTSFAQQLFTKAFLISVPRSEVGAQKQIILEVYEPTDRPDALRIVSHNLFLNVTQDRIEACTSGAVSQRRQTGLRGHGTRFGAAVSQFNLPPAHLTCKAIRDG